MRRLFLMALMATVLVAVALILSACQAAPTPPPPTPTKAVVAAPTPTTAPAAPTSTKPPPVPTHTAPASVPTKAPATPGPKAKGKIVVVIPDEPGNFQITNFAAGMPEIIVGFNVVEALTDRDFKTNELVGVLAEKWELVKPDTWRFTLRKGIQFHNGEPFNAEAAAWSINRVADPASGAKLRSQMGPQITAKAVDDYTLDIVAEQPDPIAPMRLYFFPIIAPKWAKENPEETPIKLVGTGPYKWVEWNKGQYVKFTANDDYWGPTKPTIKDVSVLWRSEASVRASMLRTGEVQIGYYLNTDDAPKVPKAVPTTSAVTFIIRFNTDSPVLKDVRVRQALNLCIDRKAIADKLFGGYAAVASQIAAPSVLGYNPDLKPYPYDVAKAKQLMKDAGYGGQTMEFHDALGNFAREGEVYEAIINYFRDCGFSIKEVRQERAKWLDMLYAVKPDQKKADILPVTHSVDVGDASRTFESYFSSSGRMSLWNDPKVDEIGKKAGALVGKEREKAYQEMFAYVYDQVPVIPIVHLQFIYGMTKNVDWTPRMDRNLRLKEIKLLD